MTLKKLLLNYVNKETDAISAIRMLSGMFDPTTAVSFLSIICAITRHEQGDMDTAVFKSVFGLDKEVEYDEGPDGEVGPEGIKGPSVEQTASGSTGMASAGATFSAQVGATFRQG